MTVSWNGSADWRMKVKCCIWDLGIGMKDKTIRWWIWNEGFGIWNVVYGMIYFGLGIMDLGFWIRKLGLGLVLWDSEFWIRDVEYGVRYLPVVWWIWDMGSEIRNDVSLDLGFGMWNLEWGLGMMDFFSFECGMWDFGFGMRYSGWRMKDYAVMWWIWDTGVEIWNLGFWIRVV